MRAKHRRIVHAFAVALAALCLLPSPAHAAYIDMGLGSMLFQAVVGAVLAVGYVVKSYWRRIVAMFRRDGGGGDSGR